MTVTNGIDVHPAAIDLSTIEPRVRSAIAVLVTRFPRIDETFILREINELERLGQPVVLVPLLRHSSRVVHEEAKPWLGRALYMPLLSVAILRANLVRLVREPRRYLRLLGRLVIGTIFRPGVLIRTLALFPKSVYLAEVLPRVGIKHVHAHFAVHPATMAYIIHELSDTTYSFTVHGPDVFVHRLMLREKIARAKFVRAVSTFNKAFLAGLYPAITDDKIEVIHIGVNPEVYAKAASEASQPATRTRILSVAALTQAKGFRFLVDACARLVHEGFDLECTIVGEGPLRPSIQERIEQNGMSDRIRLTGALPQHEVARLIGECDIFVLPSVIAYNGQMDGIPITLMEAMAAARPVVASAISGIPELVEHEVSGILVDATHPDRIAGSIRRLIENPALRMQMGLAGQKRVRLEFDVRRDSAQMIDLFERHEQTRPTVAQRIASFQWHHLHPCALGVRRVRERLSSYIAEVTITDGISKRDVVIKQQRLPAAESQRQCERARREFEALTTLRAAMGDPAEAGGIRYSVPRVLVFDPDRAALVMERAAGEPLDRLIRETRNRGLAGRLLIPLRRAGTWLRRMQTVTRSADDGADLLTALLAVTLRDLELTAAADRAIRKEHDRIVAFLRHIEQRAATRSLPIVGHHADYRPANIFMDRRQVHVIDFEEFRQALPLEDVAYFLVHLSLYFAYPFFRHGLSRLEESFLEGYADGEPVDPDLLRLFKLSKALQLLARGDEAPGGAKAWIHRRALRGIVRGIVREA